jgi:hypothetical protein
MACRLLDRAVPGGFVPPLPSAGAEPLHRVRAR